MRIKRLELKNFRGFEELTINFPEAPNNVAVFVGVNGSGKTSVLEAIKNLLDRYIDEVKPYYEVITDEPDKLGLNIKKGKKFFVTSLEIDEKIILKQEINEIGEEFSIKIPEKVDKNQVSKKEGIGNIIVFHSTDRYVQTFPSLKAKDINFEIWLLFKSSNSFNDFFSWFRSTEDYENEQIRFTDNSKYRSKELEAVRRAISIFLPNFNNPRVQRQPQEELIVEKNGEKLSISNLSHGERLMFAMVGDIARRLSIANPSLDDPLQGEGVVLIDEIELHLHPGWQRKIVPLLTKTFPNIQFILTTHSPQVISSVERESVFILEDFKLVEKTPHTFGRDSNSILQDLFNVTERPEEVKKEFRKLYRLMDKPEEIEATKHLLEEMEEKYGNDDPEIMRAKMHLEFLNEE
ncbi:MAG: AAA family ATPase [Saprospiraceae bacterium]|nr:AAA family ATPase [Saprospiraceae bacterium]